jgi:hypothetical protein
MINENIYKNQGRPKLQATQLRALGLTKNRFFFKFIRPPNNFIYIIYRPRVQKYYCRIVWQLSWPAWPDCYKEVRGSNMMKNNALLLYPII